MKIRISLMMLLLIAICGCSKGGESTGGGDSYDPCKLLTLGEAESALGIKLKVERHDVEAANATGQKICMYGDAADEDMKFVQLSLHSEADMSKGIKASGKGIKFLFESSKSFASNPVDVPGVGNAAFYGGSGLKPGAGLTVLVTPKGLYFNVVVGLGRGNSDQQAHISMEKALAQKVIDKL